MTEARENLEGRRLRRPEPRQCPTKDSVRIDNEGVARDTPEQQNHSPSDVARQSYELRPTRRHLLALRIAVLFAAAPR